MIKTLMMKYKQWFSNATLFTLLTQTSTQHRQRTFLVRVQSHTQTRYLAVPLDAASRVGRGQSSQFQSTSSNLHGN